MNNNIKVGDLVMANCPTPYFGRCWTPCRVTYIYKNGSIRVKIVNPKRTQKMAQSHTLKQKDFEEAPYLNK